MLRGMKSFFARTRLLATLTTALLFFCAAQFSVAQVPAPAQPQAPPLTLKAASYQSVTKYEIHAEPVRYFSAERGEWEEVPKSLIDWDATEKFEQGRLQGKLAPEG